MEEKCKCKEVFKEIFTLLEEGLNPKTKSNIFYENIYKARDIAKDMTSV